MRAVFDGMTWPIPDHNLGWRMRYSAITTEDKMAAASELDSYARLISLPQQRRNYIISKIRKAMSEASYEN